MPKTKVLGDTRSMIASKTSSNGSSAPSASYPSAYVSACAMEVLRRDSVTTCRPEAGEEDEHMSDMKE